MTKKKKSDIEAVRAAMLGPIKSIEEMQKKKSVAAAVQRRIIEIIFAWSFEYRLAFVVYEQRLKDSRHDDRTACAAS